MGSLAMGIIFLVLATLFILVSSCELRAIRKSLNELEQQLAAIASACRAKKE